MPKVERTFLKSVEQPKPTLTLEFPVPKLEETKVDAPANDGGWKPPGTVTLAGWRAVTAPAETTESTTSSLRSAPLTREAYAAASPADRKEMKIEAIRRRAELGIRIDAHVQRLDARWAAADPETRAQALRAYHDHTRRLDPTGKRALMREVRRAEFAHRRQEIAEARLQVLAARTQLKKAEKAEQAELKKEVSAAKAEQTEAVEQATQVVDAKGLKTDRLALTEQIIDPTAPAIGSGQSLFDELDSYFQLTSFVEWTSTFNDAWQKRLDADTKRKETRRREEDRTANAKKQDLKSLDGKDDEKKLRGKTDLRVDRQKTVRRNEKV